MDHLPIPDSCKNSAWSVIYYGQAPHYDKLGFEGFEERHNFKIDPKTVNWTDNVASFLQEWLWFGPLHEFELACGVPIDRDALIIHYDFGTSILNTTELVRYLRSIVVACLGKHGASKEVTQEFVFKKGVWQKQKSLDGSTLSELFSRLEAVHDSQPEGLCSVCLDVDRFSIIEECLQKVRQTVRLILLYPSPDLPMETIVSIDILCETLRDVLSVLYARHISIQTRSTQYRHYFLRRMQRKGWCQARVETMAHAQLVHRYLMSLLPTYDNVLHFECGKIFCKESKKRLPEVRPQHHMRSCTGFCGELSIDQAELVQILDLGGNPGIAAKIIAPGLRTYKVVDTQGKNFIAISHVWSHGLGNSKSNALPLCQMVFLFKLLRDMEPSEDVVLWIDTLSVPADGTHKRIAISKLREVYRYASKVLVLDKRLMQVGDHWLERRLHVLCCEWLSRLWTLQEGRLASNLYFQFRDSAASVSELSSLLLHPEQRSDNDWFGSMIETTSQQIREHFIQPSDQNQLFLELVGDLAHRSATVPSDEPICIATMLGLALENYHPYPTMPDIYKSLPYLPTDLIFVPGPRLTQPGFRWAPATFLEIRGQSGLNPDEKAVLKNDGLFFKKNCVLITSALTYTSVGNAGKYLYSVQCGLRRDFAFESYQGVSYPAKTFSSSALIIMETSPTFKLSVGILISDPKFVDQVCYGHFEMIVVIWRRYAFNNEERIASRGKEARQFDLEGKYYSDLELCLD